MATPGFLDANRARAYPLVARRAADGLAALPDAALVDFGAAVRAAGYDPVAHPVTLFRVERAGATLRFAFRCPHPATAGEPLWFERDVADEPFTASFSLDRPPPGSSASEGRDECRGAGAWWGYLVTGDLAPLAAALPSGAHWAGDAAVEPATVDAHGPVVDRVRVLNDDRTRYAPPADCGGEPWAPGAVVDTGACLSGPVVFVPGYNATARVDRAARAVVIGAVVGAGEGQPDAEVPLTPAEGSASGWDTLAGGPTCCGVLRELNGLPGPRVAVVARGGVSVEADPAGGVLTVRFAAATRGGGCPPGLSASESR